MRRRHPPDPRLRVPTSMRNLKDKRSRHAQAYVLPARRPALHSQRFGLETWLSAPHCGQITPYSPAG
jgi:hypothetical protein